MSRGRLWCGSPYGKGLNRARLAEFSGRLEDGATLSLAEQVELLETVVSLQDQRIALRAELRAARDEARIERARVDNLVAQAAQVAEKGGVK